MNTGTKGIADEIRKALDKPDGWPARQNLFSRAPTWLRSLLEERSKLLEALTENVAKKTGAYESLEEWQGIVQSLRSELAATRYEITEIGKEATAGLNGDLERADAALQQINLLSKNILATINESKPDTATTSLG